MTALFQDGYRQVFVLALASSLFGAWLSIRLMRGRPPPVVAPLGLSHRGLVIFAAALQAPLVAIAVVGLYTGALPELVARLSEAR